MNLSAKIVNWIAEREDRYEKNAWLHPKNNIQRSVQIDILVMCYLNFGN